MKKSLLTALFASASITLFSQVGINTATPNAMLDVNGSFATQQSIVKVASGSVTIPTSTAFAKITDATANFTINFATTTTYSKIPDGQRIVLYNATNYTGTYSAETNKTFSIPPFTAQEFIYSDTKWYSFKAAAQDFVFPEKLKWFYAPSIVLDTSVSTTAKTVNVYDNYVKQFTKNSNPNSSSSADNYGFISSNSAKTTIPYYNTNTDFDYFITGYDREVFSNVSISTTGLLSYTVKSAATDKTFMNIVLVPKN